MIPRTLLLALAVLCAHPALAQVRNPPAADEGVAPELPPLGPDLEVSTPTVVATKEAASALQKAGWALENDGSLTRREGKSHGVIPLSYLERASFEWKDGRLKYKRSPSFVDYELYARVLSGLHSFTAAAAVKPAEAGAALASWGLPPTAVGRRLYEPGGKATYFGLMLHQQLAPKPASAARLGIERLQQVLALYDEAYGQAFNQQAPDIAQGLLERARALLFMPPRAGETALSAVMGGEGARQNPATMLKGYKEALEKDIQAAKDASDEGRRKASEQALAVLNTLERQRVYAGNTLQEIPEPGKDAPPSTPGGRMTRAIFGVGEGGGEPEKKDEPPPYAPLASGLPGLLRVLDRVNGTPLTVEQQRDLIQSFPMGDLVWRTGVHELWKRGLTGKGVKVAVIDEGIAEHPELEEVVDSRSNLTPQRGAASVGDHGTHVAGIIHSLAPDARLNGYAVFPGGFGGNRKLAENPTQAIVAAIHKAVADGNQIVNMSLGSGAGPSDDLARVVEEYSRKGVIFVVSAGNSRHYAGGVGAPSSAPSAISVGSTDWTGRMSDFSSYGERFDARSLQTVVKDVFLFPGGDILSTAPEGMMAMGPGEKAPRYQPMSGTSMAAPGLTGVTALMVQEITSLPVRLNPVATADKVKAALRLGSAPVALDRLPTEVPLDQPFLVVDPVRAVDALGTPESDSVAGTER